MFRRLVKTDAVTVAERAIPVRYYEVHTLRGRLRFSVEILLGPGDRIILDDDSIWNLETRVTRLVPTTLYSRLLAQGNLVA